jgi:MFS superfamily sulfate permease-like transporter
MLLRCQLKISPCLVALLCLLHIAALVTLLLTRINPSLIACVAAGVLASLVFFLARIIRRTHNFSETSLELNENEVRFFDEREVCWQGALLPQTVVLPYLVVLYAKNTLSGKVRAKLICADSLSRDEFCKLRTLLRLV